MSAIKTMLKKLTTSYYFYFFNWGFFWNAGTFSYAIHGKLKA